MSGNAGQPQAQPQAQAQAQADIKPVKFLELFRYADRRDKIMYSAALVAAVVNGASLPLFAWLFGRTLNDLGASRADVVDQLQTFALYFFVLGIATFFLTFAENGLAAISSERQVNRLREAYLRALLRQDVGYLDVLGTGEVASRLAEETILVQTGIGERATEVLHYVSTFVFGLVLGLILSWRLALVILALVPLIVLAGTLLRICTVRLERRATDAYARAGSCANEAIQGIRIVTAYNGQERELKRYGAHLDDAASAGKRKGFYVGIAVGLLFAAIFISYAVGLRYGATLIIDSREEDPICRVNPTTEGCFSGGTVISVFFAVLIGSMSLGQIAPNISQVARAQAAAARMYALIARVPPIDIEDTGGIRVDPHAVRGKLEFRDVSFAYPSRPDRQILRNFSMVVEAGQSVGLVGPSGCGKSTIIALLLRFYNPQEGEILLDDVPLRDYNLVSLRNCMGLVSQEPVLLSTSVRENIASGRVRAPEELRAAAEAATADAATANAAASREHATLSAAEEDVLQAAYAAQATDFVKQLPRGFATLVGERGSQLSGGQRQRIAISRALIRDPRILLLDEATSALSSLDEAAVQATLNRLITGTREVPGVEGPQTRARTTLQIAHRLSTISRSDRIIVMEEGSIVEDGTHEVLISHEESLYARLWRLQEVHGITTAVDQQQPQLQPEPQPQLQLQPQPQVQVQPHRDRVTALPSASTAIPVDPTGPPAAAAIAASSISTDTDDAVEEPAAPSAIPRVGWWAKVRAFFVSTFWSGPSDEYEQKAVPFARVFEYQRPEMRVLIAALVVAAANGVIFPAFSILYSNIIIIYFNPVDAELLSEINLYMWLLFGIAAIAFLLNWMQTWSFTYLGEQLTRRLRLATYRAILRQPIQFFDASSTGVLTSRLAADAALVKATQGERIGLLIMTSSGMLAGFIIAFVATWRLALVLLVLSPFLVFGAFMQTRLQHRGSADKDKAMAEAGSVAVEALAAIRTVTAFNLQPLVMANFRKALAAPLKVAYTQAQTGAFLTALGQFFMFSTYAAAFFFGSLFIEQGTLDFESLTKAYFAVILASRGTGMASAQAADVAKGKSAVRNVFALLDRVSDIDPLSDAGIKVADIEAEQQQRGITFRNCSFAYPTRPDVQVLRNFSMHLRPGEVFGLCGPSGSGKSTVIALLCRFYDVQDGEVLFDGVPLKELNVRSLRAALGLVSQQPELFDVSLADNIAYGRADAADGKTAAAEAPTKLPSEPLEESKADLEQGIAPAVTSGSAFPPVDADVLQAAVYANAADFVSLLPAGFATLAGTQGSQLSGGQRQRIAISRALIRHPRVLLLDEATSALSSIDEAAVQATLNQLMREGAEREGRSSLVVAHRLSTIRAADRILVLSAGRVVQEGRHEELVEQPHGLYAQLAGAQAVQRIT
jgi:ATP-binding cassette subfamily B (MDR/TAP) protein 1